MGNNQGLSTIKARELLNSHGLNEITEKTDTTFWKLILSQFTNLLTLLLMAASLLSFLIGDPIDGALILALLILNTSLGFWQEYKATKEMAVLKKMEVSQSRVIRDGKQAIVLSQELVPGDVILLEAGDKIPADAVLFESFSLFVNESSLTGESLPVLKTTDESDNKIFLGSSITSGRGKATVVFTGTQTRFGDLALKLSKAENESTPLEIQLNKLAKTIGLAVFIVAVLLFSVRILQQNPFKEVLFSSIALIVAAVPEGLPTVITFLLVIGVRRMYHKKTLVRKLASIESLGSTTLICADKTGTLTENKLEVSSVENFNNQKSDLLLAAILCNSAQLISKENHGSSDILGDSTEGALLQYAHKQGLNIDEIRRKNPIVDELPFNLQMRLMGVVTEGAGKLFVKGAPESILPLSKLSSKQMSEFEQKYQALAQKGLRVLAFAQKKIALDQSNIKSQLKPNTLELLGLMAIADQIRSEAKSAVERAKLAGIKVVMVTGDNELTAKSVGEQVGILSDGDQILTGFQLDELTDEELDQMIPKVKIFARSTADHKVRIVNSYQRNGEVVAVTGDGVNDALALKNAQVGVAMGKIGTDVAKEASDIVILDDNLSTIIDAVEQGRIIYNNIIKTIKFLLTGNFAELLVISGISFLGFPAPLLPSQILWINFVTDGLPALSLAADNASSSTMRSKPRNKNESILNSKNLILIVVWGVLISVVNLAIYFYFYQNFSLSSARTAVFNSLVISQMIFIFLIRRHHTIFSNKYLLLSVGSVILMQGLITFLPLLRALFKL